MFMIGSSKVPKPDLGEHEDETVPFDEVLRKLVEAKPAPKKTEPPKQPKK